MIAQGDDEGSTNSYTVRLSYSPIHHEFSRLLREGVEPQAPTDGIIGGLSTTQEVELQCLVQQLQLSDRAPGTSTFALTAPSSPDHMSLMTLYFPDEIDENGTFVEIGDIEDAAMPRD